VIQKYEMEGKSGAGGKSISAYQNRKSEEVNSKQPNINEQHACSL